MTELKQKLLSLPTTSGVYLMKDKSNNVIYVGKAKNLKRRVNSYFINKADREQKTVNLVSNIVDFDFILTSSELDAFVLENNLIKKYQPFYNILLKDGKQYPYIKIDTHKPFANLEITRKVKRDGAKYFGPFLSGVNPREIIEIINYAYPIRTCSYKFSEQKPLKRECLNYSMGLCLAPCTNKITTKEYNAMLKDVMDFLNGDTKKVEEILKFKMEKASENLQFERAIKFRETLKNLEKITHNFTAQFPKDLNVDVVGTYTNGITSGMCILLIRNGKMLGSEKFYIINNFETLDEAVTSLLNQYYNSVETAPKSIVLPFELEDKELLGQSLCNKFNKKIELKIAQRGILKSLLKLSEQNAKEFTEKNVNSEKLKKDKTLGACESLKEKLNLNSVPFRMECYDISNISGTNKVASMVVFINGEKASKMYRKFIIKTVEGSNDFASLEETLERRIKEYFKGTDVSFSQKPNLLVIDGGKGQLSSVQKIVEKYNFDVDLISLAKREEEVFKPNQSTPILLKRNDYALKLLQNIRDEAHRFAITFHRNLRGRKMLESEFLGIKGIGKVKLKQLLKHFGSFDKIKNASVEELLSIKGINEQIAKQIKELS